MCIKSKLKIFFRHLSKKNIYVFWSIFLFSILIASQLPSVASAGSAVEVWDHYNVTIRVDSTTSKVTEELTIRNVIDKPVVPGYGYISLCKEQSPTFLGLPLPFEKGIEAMKVRDVSARLDDGSTITDVLVTEEGNCTTVRYGFWVPVMPGECRTVIIEYTTDDIIEKGMLFDHITYTIQPSSIPIESALIRADLEGKHVSYSSSPPESNGDAVSWTQNDLTEGTWKLDFEYSSLPLPRSPLRWAFISWGLMFGIISLWSYRQWKVEK